MSIKPDDQSLEKPIDKLMEGIEEFTNASYKRMKSREWAKEHIDEINSISLELTLLKARLYDLKDGVW